MIFGKRFFLIFKQCDVVFIIDFANNVNYIKLFVNIWTPLGHIVFPFNILVNIKDFVSLSMKDINPLVLYQVHIWLSIRRFLSHKMSWAVLTLLIFPGIVKNWQLNLIEFVKQWARDCWCIILEKRRSRAWGNITQESFSCVTPWYSENERAREQ